MGHAGEGVLGLLEKLPGNKLLGSTEKRRTGPLGSKVFGSKAWSEGSFMGRESRMERKDLVKDSSVIVVG